MSNECLQLPKASKGWYLTGLQGIHLSYRDAILFISCWAYKMTAIEFCERELGIGHNTGVDGNNCLREVSAAYRLANPLVIGGPGKVFRSAKAFSGRKYDEEGYYHSSGSLLAFVGNRRSAFFTLFLNVQKPLWKVQYRNR